MSKVDIAQLDKTEYAILNSKYNLIEHILQFWERWKKFIIMKQLYAASYDIRPDM